MTCLYSGRSSPRRGCLPACFHRIGQRGGKSGVHRLPSGISMIAFTGVRPPPAASPRRPPWCRPLRVAARTRRSCFDADWTPAPRSSGAFSYSASAAGRNGVLVFEENARASWSANGTRLEAFRGPSAGTRSSRRHTPAQCDDVQGLIDDSAGEGRTCSRQPARGEIKLPRCSTGYDDMRVAWEEPWACFGQARKEQREAIESQTGRSTA
jgi:hypothetical protein